MSSTTTKVKDVLTTGEVAKICNVAPRTVSKWFDSGALHGYRIPGSKDRRIPLNQLIRFMKQHGMPLNGLMTGSTRILIVDDEQDIVEVLEKILEDEAKYEVEVAKICNVAPRTVSKWFDSGALTGYRIPGSKDRRIPLNQLIRFMKQHGMPLNGLMTGSTRILIVDDEQDIIEVLEKILEDEAKYEVEVTKGGFSAGVTAEKFRPHVILMDMHLKDIDAPEVCRQVKKNTDLQLTKVIAMSGKLTDTEVQGLMTTGFDGFLRKPFHVRQVIQAVEDAMAIVY